MERDELINSREYWITKIQIELFSMIEEYRIAKKYTKTQLAEELGFTKGYITQVLNGDFDHKISKLVDLALACGKVPEISFTSINEILSTIPLYEAVSLSSEQEIKKCENTNSEELLAA